MGSTLRTGTMSPRLRKIALTAHVASSVGWLGAVTAFMALAIVGLSTSDPERAKSAYISMEETGWLVIVPFSFASLATGLVQSLGTEWGLFRHYWVIAKLLLTVVATAVLLLHMNAITYVADQASTGAAFGSHLQGVRIQLVADAGAAAVVLLLATALSVFKPRGVTVHGRRWLAAKAERRC